MDTKYRRISRAAVAVAVGLAVGSGAEAATVVGRWDPEFGGNNGTLGWNGTAQFSLPDPCLTGASTGSGSIFVFNDGSGCAMQLDTATVNLYDINTYDPNNSSTYDTLTFGTTPFQLTDGMEIKDVDGINAVVGLQTSQAVPFSSFDSTGNVYFGPFDMWWILGAVDPVIGRTYYSCDIEGYCTDTGQQSTPAVVALTTCGPDGCRTVPEPGTIGLLFGALGAGWLARRRKTTT